MNLILVVMHPREAVIGLLSEAACDLAGDLDHVESASVLSHRVTPERRVVCIQRWRARAAVPALLRPHFEDGLLDWTVSTERAIDGHECRWHAESAAIQVPGRCHGAMSFLSAAGGRGTRIEMHYEFPASNEGMRTIFRALLDSHWRSLAEAAARRIASNAPRA